MRIGPAVAERTVIERYITRNPMRVEGRRAIRKFVGMGKVSRQAVGTGVAVLGTIYVIVVCLLLAYGRDVDPAFVAYTKLFFMLLVSAIANYGAIVGERERRTWDVLRAGPVTRGQILIGKFIGGMSVVGLIWLLSLPFCLANALAYEGLGTSSNLIGVMVLQAFHSHRLLQLLLTDLIAFGSSVLVLSFTLAVSARSRRSLGAMSVVLGSLFFWLAILPMLLSTATAAGGGSDKPITYVSLNPFRIDAEIADMSSIGRFGLSEPAKIAPSEAVGVTVFGLLAYALLSSAFVFGASRNLNLD